MSDEGDAVHGLHGPHGLYEWRHRPLWRQPLYPLGQAVHTNLSAGHGMNVVLRLDLARRVIRTVVSQRR